MAEVEVKLYEMMARKNIRTIEKISQDSGLSRKAISRILDNKNVGIKTSTAAKLCKALDCEIGELIVIKK